MYRPGGPHALITDRCLFSFDKSRARFTLASVHPGHTVEEIAEQTGFDYDLPEGGVPETAAPDAETLALIRGPVAQQLAEIYPSFASRVFGIDKAA